MTDLPTAQSATAPVAAAPPADLAADLARLAGQADAAVQHQILAALADAKAEAARTADAVAALGRKVETAVDAAVGSAAVELAAAMRGARSHAIVLAIGALAGAGGVALLDGLIRLVP